MDYVKMELNGQVVMVPKNAIAEFERFKTVSIKTDQLKNEYRSAPKSLQSNILFELQNLKDKQNRMKRQISKKVKFI